MFKHLSISRVAHLNITGHVNYTYSACIRNCINQAVIDECVLEHKALCIQCRFSVAVVPMRALSHASTRASGRKRTEGACHVRASVAMTPRTVAWSACVLYAFASPISNATGLQPSHQRASMRQALSNTVRIGAIRRARHICSVATLRVLRDDEGNTRHFLLHTIALKCRQTGRRSTLQ